MPDRTNPVVASLASRSPHPYSSISLSPDRKYAISGGKDKLQLIKIDSYGLYLVRSFPISQFFQTSVPSAAPSGSGKRYGDVRDAFTRDGRPKSPTRSAANAVVGITCVAWSFADPLSLGLDDSEKVDVNYTSVAAAGTNGVVVIWNAKQAFFSESTAGAVSNQQPEAVLNQHTRAVNSMAWHPTRAGMLLTASQDSTVKLWERRDRGPQSEKEYQANRRTWFGAINTARSTPGRAYSWECKGTFDPKSEAVRDIKWSLFQDDVFALVTVSGSLILYSMHVHVKALVKIAAHTGDATSVDWHPLRPYTIATGGAGDRCVKVWDLEDHIAFGKSDGYTSQNANTARSEFSNNSSSSADTERLSYSPTGLSIPSFPTGGPSNSQIQSIRLQQASTLGSAYRQKTNPSNVMHVLSISAAVTKVMWRPPAIEKVYSNEEGREVDRNDSMLAVATARLTSAGGSGILALWSFHRPFMPLSIVEGHDEGAVADFVWIETPPVPRKAKKKQKEDSTAPKKSTAQIVSKLQKKGRPKPETSFQLKHAARRNQSGRMSPSDDIVEASAMRDADPTQTGINTVVGQDNETATKTFRVWQHALSVGRNGQCILQSFARGDRPISRVPQSCFTMANLSPFQEGFGSLQVLSIHQKVPSGRIGDFALTGLRQDDYTAKAAGVFKEMPPLLTSVNKSSITDPEWATATRLPVTVPNIVFNVVDQGELEDGEPTEESLSSTVISPEVMHLSRFANSYRLYPDSALESRADLCHYNADVASRLHCDSLGKMWRSLGSILEGSGIDELPSRTQAVSPDNAMQFTLLPTIKSLLEERAEVGDVQTCVALCEVLQVFQGDGFTRIPGLNVTVVREWYLSYIDILQQMCLFSSASFLIRNCKDPVIAVLNQQGTTIHESCPRCQKPLLERTATSDGGSSTNFCKNCRQQVGFCFLCHQPVKGMFVWCPGCGHGGHLDHALAWFGGLNGKPVREVCPTGCGHRCNLSQTVSSFPRTLSLACLPALGDDE